MKKLGYILYIYLGAAACIILAMFIYQYTSIGTRVLFSVGALALDTAVVLDCIRRVKEKLPILAWGLCAFCAAAAFTLAAVEDWITIL